MPIHPTLLPSFDLTGKTALVTGASRGIGAATADRLAAAGADLVLVSRHIDRGAVTAAYAERYGRPPLVRQADIGDFPAMRSVVEAGVARFGGIDILVNNAAMPHYAPVIETPPETWAEILRVDLVAASYLCALVAPIMAGRGGGRIINIASNLGAFALRGRGVYGAAKAGLLQLTRSLAVELAGQGTLVNALAVGAVNTDAESGPGGTPARNYSAIEAGLPLRRLGTASEIAGAVLFLATPLSSYITGQTIFIDGGGSIWFRDEGAV